MLPSQNRKNFKCPVDNVPCIVLLKTVSHFPKNQLLIQIIDGISKVNFCSEHQKQIEWKCISEDLSLCTECTVKESLVDLEIMEAGEGTFGWKDVVMEFVEANRNVKKVNIGKMIKKKNIRKNKGGNSHKEAEEDIAGKYLNMFLAVILVFNPFFWWFSHEKKMMKISR